MVGVGTTNPLYSLDVAGNINTSLGLRVNSIPSDYIYASGSGTLNLGPIALTGYSGYSDRLVPIILPIGCWIEVTMWGTGCNHASNGIKFDPYISELNTFTTLTSSANTYDNSYGSFDSAAAPPHMTWDPNQVTYGILLNWTMINSNLSQWNTKISWYNITANNTYYIPMQTDTSSVYSVNSYPNRQYGSAGVKTTTGTTTTISGFRILTQSTTSTIPTLPMTYNYRVKVLN